MRNDRKTTPTPTPTPPKTKTEPRKDREDSVPEFSVWSNILELVIFPAIIIPIALVMMAVVGLGKFLRNVTSYVALSDVIGTLAASGLIVLVVRVYNDPSLNLMRDEIGIIGFGSVTILAGIAARRLRRAKMLAWVVALAFGLISLGPISFQMGWIGQAPVPSAQAPATKLEISRGKPTLRQICQDAILVGPSEMQTYRGTQRVTVRYYECALSSSIRDPGPGSMIDVEDPPAGCGRFYREQNPTNRIIRCTIGS